MITISLRRVVIVATGSLLAILYPLASPAQDAVGGSITYRVTFAPGEISSVVYTVRNGNNRIDMTMGENGSDSVHRVSMILNRADGTLTYLLPATKSYVTLALGGAGIPGMPKRVVRDSDVAYKSQARPQLVPTGKSEVIAGVTCADYVTMSAATGETDLCLARGLGALLPVEIPEGADHATDALAAMQHSYEIDSSGPSVPLSVETHQAGVTRTMIATHIDRIAPDSSVFVIPRDYRPQAFGLPR